MVNFKKIFKISDTINGMKVKLQMHIQDIIQVQDIIFYIFFFHCCCSFTFVAMATSSADRLGKKITLYVAMATNQKVEISNSSCKFLFTELFLEQSCMFLMIFVKIGEFDWFPWQHKGEIFSKNLKVTTHVYININVFIILLIYLISLQFKVSTAIYC